MRKQQKPRAKAVTEEVFNKVKELQAVGVNKPGKMAKVIDGNYSAATIGRIMNTPDWKTYVEEKQKWADEARLRDSQKRLKLSGIVKENEEEKPQPSLFQYTDKDLRMVEALERIATALETLGQILQTDKKSDDQ